jgi:hypothetical protein
MFLDASNKTIRLLRPHTRKGSSINNHMSTHERCSKGTCSGLFCTKDKTLGNEAIILLMKQQIDALCKELLGLLLEPLHHCRLHPT